MWQNPRYFLLFTYSSPPCAEKLFGENKCARSLSAIVMQCTFFVMSSFVFSSNMKKTSANAASDRRKSGREVWWSEKEHHTVLSYSEMEFWNGIFTRLKLESSQIKFLSGFLIPSFFISTRCCLGIDSSFLVLLIIL